MNISIYDNYSGVERGFDFFLIDGKYKSCNSLLLIICLRGRGIFSLRGREFEMRRCSSLLIAPETPFYIMENSEDFHIDVIRIGNDVIHNNLIHFGHSTIDISQDKFLKQEIFKLLYERPMHNISEKKTTMFHIIHSYLKVLKNEEDELYRDLIIYQYLKIFFLEACHIHEMNSNLNKGNKRENILTKDFFALIETNFRENRKVEFYASEIGVTAKHLASTIKKTTGRHPSEWLDEYTLIEAKKLLRSGVDTIQSISIDLNFATPSHFSSFFKSRTGMTPKEFRNKEIV